MMFITFHSQKERSGYGGTCFIELQYCKYPAGTDIEQIVKDTDFWQNDSLYIEEKDHASFYTHYKDIFGSGIHYDLSEGYFDIWGITYYGPEWMDEISERALTQKPEDYAILLKWLARAKEHNGFYIVGV